MIIEPSWTTKKINAALKREVLNKTKEIVFKLGNYNLTECLVLHSNTKVTCEKGVVFYRKHKGRMLELYVTPDTKAYKGVHDITWTGGTFLADSRSENANVISLFHGKNLTFENVRIEGCRGMHSLEINACKDVLIKGFSITNQSSKDNATYREAIQIDFANKDGLSMKGATGFSSCYDGTHCKNIEINDCYISDCPNGIGTHTVSTHGYHKNVVITDCWINVEHNAIQLFGFDGCVIDDCHYDECPVLIGTKDTAHLNYGGKDKLLEPKGNKNVTISRYVECDDGVTFKQAKVIIE